jgi:uncharacterized membrane protein YcjF (UPF0283 family)
MNLKSDIYFKNLIQIVFFILFGVSSIVGQNMLIQLYIKEAWITFTLSSTWTVILIALYSYLVSVKEQKLKDLENSFEWHKLLITDSKTHMKPAAEVAPVADTVPAPPTRNDISKIEFVHTLEEMNKVPDFLVQKDTKK